MKKFLISCLVLIILTMCSCSAQEQPKFSNFSYELENFTLKNVNSDSKYIRIYILIDNKNNTEYIVMTNTESIIITPRLKNDDLTN